MKEFFGKVLITIGSVLLVAAVTLVIYNHIEATNAETKSAELLPQIYVQIEQNLQATEPYGELSVPEQPLGTPVEYLTQESLKMTEIVIDGYAYIGYISVPKLEIDLPVMADWSYPQLKISPCRYAGTVRGEDLVIMAHNYKRHFGPLADLQIGDKVIFTDMDGRVTIYQVVGTDILAPQAVEEMTSGDFDLTLFTCTYGGKSRVTVYCDIIVTKNAD